MKIIKTVLDTSHHVLHRKVSFKNKKNYSFVQIYVSLATLSRLFTCCDIFSLQIDFQFIFCITSITCSFVLCQRPASTYEFFHLLQTNQKKNKYSQPLNTSPEYNNTTYFDFVLRINNRNNSNKQFNINAY